MEEEFYYNDHGLDLINKYYSKLDSLEEIDDRKLKIIYKKTVRALGDLELDISNNTETLNSAIKQGDDSRFTKSLFDFTITKIYKDYRRLDEIKDDLIVFMSDDLKDELGLCTCFDESGACYEPDYTPSIDLDVSRKGYFKSRMDHFAELTVIGSKQEYEALYDELHDEVWNTVHNLRNLSFAMDQVYKREPGSGLNITQHKNLRTLIKNEYFELEHDYWDYRDMLDDIGFSDNIPSAVKRFHEYHMKQIDKVPQPKITSSDISDIILDAYEQVK